jgi:hypothetical protein
MEDIPETCLLLPTYKMGSNPKIFASGCGSLDENFRLLITLAINTNYLTKNPSTLNLPLGTVKKDLPRQENSVRRLPIWRIMDTADRMHPSRRQINHFAPMPSSITMDVMARIQKAKRLLSSWGDFVLSLLIASCIAALWFAAQICHIILKLRIQGICIDFLVNARWLIPAMFELALRGQFHPDSNDDKSSEIRNGHVSNVTYVNQSLKNMTPPLMPDASDWIKAVFAFGFDSFSLIRNWITASTA